MKEQGDTPGGRGTGEQEIPHDMFIIIMYFVGSRSLQRKHFASCVCPNIWTFPAIEPID